MIAKKNERIIKHKVGLLNLAEELDNVSKACQMMGLSRDTFYRYKAAVEEGGVDGLGAPHAPTVTHPGQPSAAQRKPMCR